MGREREFRFTDRDFKKVRELAAEQTGIVLTEAKEDMVYSRLAPRVRARKLKDFSTYLDQLLNSNDPADMTDFVNAITTNLTSFFREQHHFDHLRNVLLPSLLKSRFSACTSP